MAGRIARRHRLAPLRTFAVAALALLAAGCGGQSHTRTSPAIHEHAPQRTPPAHVLQPADPRRVLIVRAWANALRAGRVDAASGYFALPAVVENGGPAFRLRTSAEVRSFNAGLPCGARVVRAGRLGRYTVVTFQLTERRGTGAGCGSGTGGLAATAFAFRRNRISEWRRVPVPGRDQLPETAPA